MKYVRLKFSDLNGYNAVKGRNVYFTKHTFDTSKIF